MEAVFVLTNIAVVLLLGLIATIVSKKIKVSNVLILIMIGFILKIATYKGDQIFEFSPTFLVAIAIMALAMITFDGTSRFKIKEIDMLSGEASKIVIWFIFFNVLLLTLFTNVIFFPEFSFEYIIFSLVFAVIMVATDPGAIFFMMREKITKVIELLELEAIINTPLIVIIPFVLIDFITIGSNQVVDGVLDQIVPFLRQIIVGIGAGVVVGIIIFKAMKNAYHHQLSPLAIITATIFAYILAENLGGNGVLSVATMGLFFGNIYVKKKVSLQEFSSIFSNALEIFVFVLLGFMVSINFSWAFLLKSFGLFIILVISRWFAITTALRNNNYKLREKIFMTLNMPKGIAVAAVVFTLSMKNIPEFEIIIDLILMFIIYSLITATIVDRFSKKLIKVDLES